MCALKKERENGGAEVFLRGEKFAASWFRDGAMGGLAWEVGMGGTLVGWMG